MKGRWMIGVLAVGFVGLWLGLVASAAEAACPPDSVPSGDTCMDKYEASVWEIPPTEKGLIKKVGKGKATLADLTSPAAVAAGVMQRGVGADDYDAAGCPDTGNGCLDVYAVSIPGVTPSCCMTWFQAVAMARNSGKYLPSNQQWQAAALGTPDPVASAAGSEDCNTKDGDAGLEAVVPTGSRDNCVSDVGARDMVGNLDEWVADWVPRSNDCNPALFAADVNCLSGAATDIGPGALVRGGGFNDGTPASVFAVNRLFTPSGAFFDIGFRAAR